MINPQIKRTPEGRQFRHVRHQLLFATEYLRKQLDYPENYLDQDSTLEQMRYQSNPPLEHAETYFWTFTQTPRDWNPEKSQTVQPTLDQTNLSNNWSSWLTSWIN